MDKKDSTPGQSSFAKPNRGRRACCRQIEPTATQQSPAICLTAALVNRDIHRGRMNERKSPGRQIFHNDLMSTWSQSVSLVNG
jgi:hypothetical protein